MKLPKMKLFEETTPTGAPALNEFIRIVRKGKLLAFYTDVSYGSIGEPVY